MVVCHHRLFGYEIVGARHAQSARTQIDDAIADGKAQLPAMQAQIKQMQAQMPELDQAMAARKTAGNNMKIPATAPTAPMEELDRI